MATTNQYLTYEIHLSDLALVTSLQGSLIEPAPGITGNGIGAILAAPDDAAVKYSAPKLAPHAEFVAPCITSSWFGTEQQFPTNVATFDRKSGGWFGISWLFGDTTHYHWRGIFVYAPVEDPVGGPPIKPSITPRSFIDGFEFPLFGEGGSGSMACFSREGSRHVEGFGLALRSHSVAARNHLYTENGAAPSKKAWDRFYMRLRTLPTGSTTFWRIRETVQANVGCALDILPSGQIAAYFVQSSGNYILLGTCPGPNLNEWVRVDILSEWTWPPVTHENGFVVNIYINGANVLTATRFDTGSTSGTDVDRISSSEIGNGVANSLGLDVDDWHGCSAHPSLLSNEWINGSGIFPISPTGLDAGTTPAVWTGDYRALLQDPPDDGGATFTGATAASTVIVNTDALDICSAMPETLGAVAVNVAIKATGVQAGATLGLSTADADIPSSVGAITQLGGNWMQYLWKKGGTDGAKPTGAVNLVFNHGAAGATTIKCLMACAEVIGAFGPEDTKLLSPPPAVMPQHLGMHNSPYPSTPWARLTATPIQPVFIRSGLYTGNGTGQDLKFPVPIHFLWVRPITAPSGGTRWYSSMLGPKSGLLTKSVVDHMARAMIDTSFVGGGETYDGFPAPLPAPPATVVEAMDLANRLAYGFPKHTDESYWTGLGYLSDPVYFFGRMLGNGALGADIPPYGLYATVPSRWNTAQQQTLVKIAGSDPQSNQNTIVYCYLAFGDPGMRFMVNGCIKDHKVAANVITTLAHPTFTPLAGFFWQEVFGGASAGAYYKGTGHAPATVSPLGAAESANNVTFGAGSLTSQAGFHGSFLDIAFSLLRMDDGSGQAGKSIYIGKYTGDGNASRSIALVPGSGKRPVWAMVVPHNANAIYRDASNTTNVSQQVSADATTATGITGGDIDQIMVGITLNANGVIYEVLVFPGSDVAGNGGFSVPGDFFPVPPDAPPNAPHSIGDPQEAPDPPVADPSEPPVELPDPLPPAGPMPSLTDDLEGACEPETRRICNLALTHIGIGKQISNVATDQTREAVAIRLVYNDAIQQTLRDFAWPFATRYVQLAVLDGGVRPNSDWLFKYRQPSDCLFERRLVVSRTDVGDPAPSPFLCSSDDTGGLIFANLANAVLEYTARPKCPHTRGEPLFREAAAWKLAEAIAPALSRMQDAVVACQKGYAEAMAKATLVLRPGIPGEVPATATIDTSAAAKLANLQVINLGLIRIGARTIRNTTSDQSREAQMARTVFEQELRATLRDYPWAFATVYVTPALVGGTSTVAVNGDWQYSYRLPADTVFVRRLVSASRRTYERNPPTFKVGRDATGPLLFTDWQHTTDTPLVVEYTNRPEATVSVADPLFRDALGWRLAWTLAPSLAMIIPETPETVGRGPEDNQIQRIPRQPPATGQQLRQRAADNARQCYYFALATATTAAANEDQPDIAPIDADWISGRE